MRSSRSMSRSMSRSRSALLSAALVALVAVSASVPAHARPAPAPVHPDGSAPTATDDTGSWRVTDLGLGRYRLRWTSPTPLPVTASDPQMRLGERVLPTPRLRADGRTLTTTAAFAAPPRATDLSVVLPGASRGDAQLATAAASPYPPPAGVEEAVVDPGLRGPHAVVSSDYRLPATSLPELPADVEMQGHVVRPAQADRRSPLVVLLHGKHEYCYAPDDPHGGGYTWPCPPGTRPVPSHLGYDYLQRLLASQGYVTVSIAANGVNGQDFVPDNGARARALLVRRHLAQWAAWTAEGRYAADLSNVVLVGHSRGGEGVKQAATITPLSAPYRISGLVLLAPTSVMRQPAAYVPTVTVLGYCDGDLGGLEGQAHTDLGRDLATGDTALRSSVLVMGANHNYFNTEWTPGLSAAPAQDDWGGDPDGTCGTRTAMRLSAGEQRRVAKTYVAGAVRLLARRDDAVLPMFDGTRLSVPSAGDADVRTHAVNGGRAMLRPGHEIGVAENGGASARLCSGVARADDLAAAAPPRCGRGIDDIRTPHWPSATPAGLPTSPAVEMAWTAPGQSASLTLADPVDLAAARSLDLRTVVDADRGDVRLRVRLHDADGGRAVVMPTGGDRLPALPTGAAELGKLWAQTLRVPLDAATGVRPDRITAVELLGRSGDGRVWVLDAAAVGDGLAAVPQTRLRRISLGDVRTVEGDGPGEAHMAVPYTITGDTSSSSRVVVLSQNLMTGLAPTAHAFDLPAGRSSGTLPVPYTADDRDDIRVQQYELRVYGEQGIVADDFAAFGRLVDDDPAPTVRLERVASPVDEGDRARWRATLSAPVDYLVQVSGRLRPVPAGDTPVTVADVPRWWRLRYVEGPSSPTDPLHAVAGPLVELIEPGESTATVSVPVRDDAVAEGREAVTMTLRVPALAEGTSTIRVRAGQ